MGIVFSTGFLLKVYFEARKQLTLASLYLRKLEKKSEENFHEKNQ